MSTVVVPDASGVEALVAGDVLLAPLIFDELFVEMMGQWPILPDLGFDEAPWRDLPTIEDLQYLWLTSTPLEHLITAVAIRAHGDGEDLSRFVAQQRWLADMELMLKKEAGNGQAGADDGGGSGEAPLVASADPHGGGGDLPGESEDGDTVGEGGQDCQHQNAGTPQKVPRKRGARKAARGRGAVGDAADDSPAAA